MTIEDFIEGLNRHIEDTRKELNINVAGHLVLQKTITPHSTFKAYKSYKYRVWFVKGRHNYTVAILNREERAVAGLEEEIQRNISIDLIKLMLNWMNTPYYNQVIYGEFKEEKI